MFKIRKLFKFEMAHCLTSAYTQECLNLHGHSYSLEVILQSASLNKDGMVIDFKKLKEIVQTKILDRFDHAMVVVNDSKPFFYFLPELRNCGMKIVQVKYNPTAENMAKDFHYVLKNTLVQEIRGFVSLEIILHETDTGYASYSEIID